MLGQNYKETLTEIEVIIILVEHDMRSSAGSGDVNPLLQRHHLIQVTELWRGG